MSGNSAKVREKSGKCRKFGTSQVKVREFVQSGKFDCGSSTK